MLNSFKTQLNRGAQHIATHYYWTLRAVLFFILYCAWVWLINVLNLSFVTYFLMSSQTRFDQIGELFSTQRLFFVGFGAFAFVILLWILRPFATSPWADLFTRTRLERHFFPGLSKGIIIGAGIAITFWLTGFYRYLGIIVDLSNFPQEAIKGSSKIVAITLFVLAEEYIFRKKILGFLLREHSVGVSVAISAVLYCIVKGIQFDLGILDYLSLILVGLLLGVTSYFSGDTLKGSGMWIGILVVFHPVLSLPIFGIQGSGIMLLKYSYENQIFDWTLRFLTGGIGGPISSFSFQFVLAVNVSYLYVKNRSSLFRTPTSVGLEQN